jgi:hypothetical protein
VDGFNEIPVTLARLPHLQALHLEGPFDHPLLPLESLFCGGQISPPPSLTSLHIQMDTKYTPSLGALSTWVGSLHSLGLVLEGCASMQYDLGHVVPALIAPACSSLHQLKLHIIAPIICSYSYSGHISSLGAPRELGVGSVFEALAALAFHTPPT